MRLLSGSNETVAKQLKLEAVCLSSCAIYGSSTIRPNGACVDLEYKDPHGHDRFRKTSPRLIEEASYTVMLTEEVDSQALRGDRIIDGRFRR
jgi:hypothetical protein